MRTDMYTFLFKAPFATSFFAQSIVMFLLYTAPMGGMSLLSKTGIFLIVAVFSWLWAIEVTTRSKSAELNGFDTPGNFKMFVSLTGMDMSTGQNKIVSGVIVGEQVFVSTMEALVRNQIGTAPEHASKNDAPPSSDAA